MASPILFQSLSRCFFLSKIVSVFLAGLPSVLGWTRPVPFFPPANPHARLLAKMDNGHPNQSNAPLLPFKSGPMPDINPSYESPSTYCHGSETAAGRLLLLSVQSPHGVSGLRLRK